MRIPLMVAIVVGGCGPPAKPPAAPPVPVTISNASGAHTCVEAAVGLDRATVGLHGPDDALLAPMRQRCLEDRWSGLAIDCFATMKVDDLGKCAVLLEARSRDQMFAVIGGNSADRGSLAVAVARLSTLKVGVGECDRFVSEVALVMTCEPMPLETRVKLGNETADFWSLPTTGLSADVEQRMSRACGESLQALQQQAITLGCKP